MSTTDRSHDEPCMTCIRHKIGTMNEWQLRVALDEACDVIEAQHVVLRKIADMPIDPRPDGTHNYSRAALIQIAQEALK